MNRFDPKLFSATLAALAGQKQDLSTADSKQSAGSALTTSSLMRALAGLNKPTPQKQPSSAAVGSSSNLNFLETLAALGISPKSEKITSRGSSRNMNLGGELQTEIKKVFSERWTTRDGQVVPQPGDLALGNDAVKLEGTILYADMSGSTTLVDDYNPDFAAEIYKTYLASAARIIKDEGGTITAYDGDRVMAVFIGGYKNTSAVKAALKINWAVSKFINPSLKEQYGENTYQMSHVIGIDTSSVFASRIGVRNYNDIVWVGRAANYAAKLSSLNEGFVYITGDVFDMLHESGKFGGEPRRSMWEERTWTKMNGMRIYRSNWILSV
jgi:class 3 adenylate cyclase